MNKEMFLFTIFVILEMAQAVVLARLYRTVAGRRRRKTAADYYTDFWNTERKQRIRIFAPTYESEAQEGLKPSQILDYGNFGNFRYYLIED